MANRASETLRLFGKTLNEDGTLRAVSPSQVETFLSCNLKWFFDKKEKLQKKPPGKGALLGDQCHGRIEKFLLTGQDVRGPLELMGAGMLEPFLWAAPFRGGTGEVEAPLLNPRLQTPGGILITGFEDYHVPDPDGLWPVIIDHKFKKELRKYAPTEEELEHDTQCIMYGAHALARYPNALGYWFRHHNHQTEGEGGRYPLPVAVKVSRADGWARWLKLAAVIDGPMREAAKISPVGGGKTPEGVPFNIGACKNFGGCDFERTCAHSPQNRFVAALRNSPSEVKEEKAFSPPTKDQKMGLISQFMASPTAPAVQVPAAQAPAAKTITAKECKQDTMYVTFQGKAKFQGCLGQRAFFQSSDGGDIILNANDPVEEIVEQAPAKEIHDRNIGGIVAVAGTLGAAHATEVKTGLQALPAEKQEKARKLGIVDMSTPDNPVAPPTVAANPPQLTAPVAANVPEVAVSVAEAVEKPKRGRPTKAESEAKKAALVPGAAVVTVSEEAVKSVQQIAQKLADSPKESDESAPMLMLLVDCACPQAKDLTGFVQEVCKRVADSYGAADVRLGHKNSDLGYAGWRGCVAIEALKTPPTGLCTISSSELADPIIEALAPIAKVLVRGSVR